METRSRAVARGIGWALLPIVVTAAILAVLPPVWFGDSPYTTSLAVQALVFACYGVGFNLIFGSTNQLFLCVGALAGVGGYGAGILANETSLPMAVGVIVGTASAALVGGLLSWIAVRRSLGIIFTGIVTLVFSLGFANLLLGQRELTGSETGLIVEGIPADLADDKVGGYYLFAGLLVAFLIVFRLLQRSTSAGRFARSATTRWRPSSRASNVSRYRIIAATVGLGDDRPHRGHARLQRGVHQPGYLQFRPRGRSRPRDGGLRWSRHTARPGDRCVRLRRPG